jgi:DNA-binding MarR family transcriptional regulator
MDDPGTPPRWLDAAEMRAWLGYRRMRTRLDLQLQRDLAADSGLSEADYDVLSTLSELDGQRMRLTDLAERLLWSKSRMSHHTARMQQRGLVERLEFPGDARGSVIALTETGVKAIVAAAPAHVASVRKHFIDLLTPDELTALDALTHRVLDRLAAAKSL